jgi:regulator of replication initiation timing
MEFKTPEYNQFDNVEDYVGALKGTINALKTRGSIENEKLVDSLRKNEQLKTEIHKLERYIAEETTSTKVHKALIESAFKNSRLKSAALNGGLLWKTYEEWNESNT